MDGLLAKIKAHSSLDAVSSSSGDHDALVVVYSDLGALRVHQAPMVAGWMEAAQPFVNVDKEFGKSVVLIPTSSSLMASGGRLVLSPAGSLDDDTDDVRKIADAVKAGVARAIEAGARRPVICVTLSPPPTEARGGSIDADYSRWVEVALLAAMDASYVTLVVREHRLATQGEGAAVVEKLESIDLVAAGGQSFAAGELDQAVRRACAIEAGRRLAVDMGYGDSERMTPYNCAQTIERAVRGVAGIEYQEIKDLDVIKREYPLLYHSARASLPEKSAWPCVVKLEYRSPAPDKVREHIYMVGKGVTFDTGGISLKTCGSMRGMSRDKLGACGVAGFVLATGLIGDCAVDLSCTLAFERNAIGPAALLPDEVVMSRAGVRVLISDTDAEGRLVMADAVAECRERIVAARLNRDSRPAAIYTAATLTGHAIRAYGWYGATVANGAARRGGYDARVAAAGLAYGDAFENSVMRREDHRVVAPRTDREDVYQSNAQPSTMTDRGHQYPAAFMIRAAGLDRHSLASGPAAIPFVHVDIAGSAEDGVEPGLGLCAITGSPVAAFAGAFWSA